MLIVRIDVNNETNNIIIKERNEFKISVVYNILPE